MARVIENLSSGSEGEEDVASDEVTEDDDLRVIESSTATQSQAQTVRTVRTSPRKRKHPSPVKRLPEGQGEDTLPELDTQDLSQFLDGFIQVCKNKFQCKTFSIYS